MKPDLGWDPTEFPEQRDQVEPIVVIVDDPVRVPGIIRREGRAPADGADEGHLHRLLTAQRGLPEVRVQRTEEQEEAECREKDHLADQHHPPVGADFRRQHLQLPSQPDPNDERDQGDDSNDPFKAEPRDSEAYRDPDCIS